MNYYFIMWSLLFYIAKLFSIKCKIKTKGKVNEIINFPKTIVTVSTIKFLQVNNT
jgi:hypothetical protein